MSKFFGFTYCLLFSLSAFAQSKVTEERSPNDISAFQYCDADGDGFTTIDIANIKTIIASKHPDLIDLTETIFLCGKKITKVENVSTTPTATIVCPEIVGLPPTWTTVLDIAVNSSGQIFVVTNATHKTQNCAVVETYPIGGNALSFDPNNNMYLPSPSDDGIFRSNGTDYTTFSMWHDFNDGGGSPSGDFVFLNGKIYIAWMPPLNPLNPGMSIRLYEATVDSDYNYISHVDLGELPANTMGLASELGKLYGSTNDTLYRINLPGMTFDTIYTNPNPSTDGWSGASSLHETGIGVNAFISQSNAQNNINPLPDSWINTIAGGQTIYVAITNQVTQEVFIFPVVLTVLMPNANQPDDLTSCSSNGQTAIFDLSVQDTEILGSQVNDYAVSYHVSQSDADSGINPLSTAYQNTTNPQTIYARIISNSDANCFDTTAFELIVVSGPQLEMQSVFDICPNQEITISAPDGFVSYLWSTGQTTQNVSVSAAGTIVLTVTDAGGCEASRNISVVTTTCDIPKGVSPNGDGDNDTWNLSGLDVENVKIFNRYGMIVYEKARYVNEWNGQDKNGNELPSATYYYVAQLPSGEVKTGWVYLQRKD